MRLGNETLWAIALGIACGSCRQSPEPSTAATPSVSHGPSKQEGGAAGREPAQTQGGPQKLPMDDVRRRAATATAKLHVARMITPFFGAIPESPCDVTPSGQTEVVPPLSMRCMDGPRGECWPRDDPQEPWEYGPDAWAHPVWKLIEDVLPVEGHRYHFMMKWATVEHDDEFCRCSFTTMAFGDLDDDGVFSTFERWNCRASEDAPLSRWTNEFE